MKTSRFLSRALKLTDAEQFARTATAIGKCSGTEARITAEWTLRNWQEPDFELEEYSLGLFDESGNLAAYGILWANAEIPVRPWLTWGVHPKNHGDNLSHVLLQWAEDKGKAVVERCPPNTCVTLETGAPIGYRFAEKALEAAGFQEARAAYTMRIEMSERPAETDLPAGFAFRPYHHEDDLPLLVETVCDSFSDHYGYVEQPFEKVLADFRHWLGDNPNFDPALVLLVLHKPSGIVAGCLLGLTEDSRHPGVGFIDIVGVRRAYRRRGLAEAMMYRSFGAYWDRGSQTVALEVDGESLTNAVALYEKVGMRIHRRLMSYKKALRDGVELATVALE